MNNIFIGTILFFAGGLFAIFFKEKFKGITFLVFAAIAQVFILPETLRILLNGGQTEARLFFSEPIGISFLRLDPLAAMFVLIISLGSLLAAIYSTGYMKMYSGNKAALSSYYFFLGMMTSSMLLVVTVQNAILFLIVWEVMSISSFFLVSFENNIVEVRKASIYYLIAMQIGAAFLIAGFAWASTSTGSLDFKSFQSASGGVLNNSSGISILLFMLFFIGFGTKAGFVPMHTWLPKAHPAAPTGVSALMSGVMIKTGIYGILRIILLSGAPNATLAYFVFAVSLATGIIGIANAVSQKDLKKLLAYSSIENIGIIGMGIGIGMLGLVYNNAAIALLGFLGALLHVVNHFTFKSVLFYGAGVVYSKTHTRNIDKLGGLVKYLPTTSILFLISSLAISGLPVFSGFVSEFLIYLGLAKSFSINNLSINIVAVLGMSGLAFIGAMALLSFTKVYGITFLGLPRTQFHTQPNEKEFSLLAPMVFLVVIIFTIGLFPYLAVFLLGNVVKQFLPTDSFVEFSQILMTLKMLSNYLLIFGSLIIFFYVIRLILLRKKEVEFFKTWDCGYQQGSSRLQYTSSSYAQPFLHLVAELVPQKINVNKEPVLFPKEASLDSNAQDFFERFLIQPNLRFLKKFLNLFSWIQSGRMQQYIIYGLIFLVFLLIWIFGVS
ncbi:MAG: proton-conducting transporter transmembrane domain-containing protein [Ignavibacteriaceae bacterium]